MASEGRGEGRIASSMGLWPFAKTYIKANIKIKFRSVADINVEIKPLHN